MRDLLPKFAAALIAFGISVQANAGFFDASPAARQVNAARSNITRAINEARHDFQLSPEVRQALAMVRKTAIDYQDACNVALMPLRQSSEYAAANGEVIELERRMSWGLFDDHMTDQQLTTTAASLLAARAAVSDLEQKVLVNDQRVIAARNGLIDARGKLIALQRSFAQSIRSNPQFVQARAQLDSAERGIPRSQ